MSRKAALLLPGLAILLLASSVGAAARPVGATRADFSTDQGVAAYLNAKGLNAKGFVIQRGQFNYAGPKCPGKKWNCTKKTKVVQVTSGKHGKNRSDCGPGGTLTTTTGSSSCVIVQNASSGKNQARCSLDARGVTPIVLTCQITQTNADGDNIARIHEHVVQRDGAVQQATLNAQVTQTTGTGDNDSDVKQSIDQRSTQVSMTTSPNQNQEGRFSAIIAQTSTSGSNVSHLLQDLDQSGKASGSSSLVQRQFGEGLGNVDQTIGTATPESVPTTSKNKGKHKGKPKSNSGSFSRSRARQSEHQRLKGPGQQIQIGPFSCCSTQVGGDPDHTRVRIKQNSKQSASQDTASQSQSLTGTCTTVGDCGIRQHAQNDEDSIRVRQRCTAPEGGTCSLDVVTTCGPEGCSSGGGGSEGSKVKSRKRH
ncbi:MAG TPA: hypothetical protein VFG93_01305 [Gaiellaceae bacterium]|nr:hypothetical protein [Gaiellaceae bacterium]